MKNKLVYGIVVILSSVILFLPLSSAVSGTWSSDWLYDANGISSIGTTNASEEGWFQFIVKRPNSVENRVSKQLKQHESYSYTAYGMALTHKQGQVDVTPHYWHSPWFDS